MTDDPSATSPTLTPGDLDSRLSLHTAASNGNGQAVRTLLQSVTSRDQLNLRDQSGCTALHQAATEGHDEIVSLLLEQGAFPDPQDDMHGNTPLHEAAWKGFSRTLEVLCKYRANPYIMNKGGFSPLHLACQNGHNQSCRVLLLAGCRPDVPNNYGDTALHTSSRYGHAGVLRILVSARCDVNRLNKNGDTALHIAAAMGRRKLTRILLESGCDPNIANKQGEKASDIATRKEFLEVRDLLLHPMSKRPDDHRKLKNKKEKKKHKDEEKPRVVISPYGCHHTPNPTNFPRPRLDSLPRDPLRRGEQYYLDLSGNIRKGPVGVGYTCYCAPFFQRVEQQVESNRQEVLEQLGTAQSGLQHQISRLERRTKSQLVSLRQTMQERLAAERVDCMERGERRALVDRMEVLHHQQCLKNDMKTWVRESHAGRGSSVSCKSWRTRNSSDGRNNGIGKSKSEELLSENDHERLTLRRVQSPGNHLSLDNLDYNPEFERTQTLDALLNNSSINGYHQNSDDDDEEDNETEEITTEIERLQTNTKYHDYKSNGDVKYNNKIKKPYLETSFEEHTEDHNKKRMAIYETGSFDLYDNHFPKLKPNGIGYSLIAECPDGSSLV